MSERKVSKFVLFALTSWPSLLLNLFSCFNKYKRPRSFNFFLVLLSLRVYIFMSIFHLYKYACWMLIFFLFYFEKVLVLYGERRKVFVLDEAFPLTVKKEFEIDSGETIVFQQYDNEWEEYLDIKDLGSVKDKAKIRVVLNEVSLFMGLINAHLFFKCHLLIYIKNSI